MKESKRSLTLKMLRQQQAGPRDFYSDFVADRSDLSTQILDGAICGVSIINAKSHCSEFVRTLWRSRELDSEGSP